MPNVQSFMLKVKGDSMINAGIFDGDQVLVKQQASASNGDIVVALVEDSATVKTFYKMILWIRFWYMVTFRYLERYLVCSACISNRQNILLKFVYEKLKDMSVSLCMTLRACLFC